MPCSLKKSINSFARSAGSLACLSAKREKCVNYSHLVADESYTRLLRKRAGKAACAPSEEDVFFLLCES